MIRLPQANVWFDHQTDSSLASYAQAIHDGLVTYATTFPTLPVVVADLQDLIDAYEAALALATGPGAGKINTAAKDKAKEDLKNALRSDAKYVNQVIVGLIRTGTSYDAASVFIIGSGYQLSKDPVPAGPLPGPTPKVYGSYNPGQFYTLLYKVPNAKGYVVRVFNQTTGATAYDVSFPNTRILLTGLTSGNTYSFQFATIGANPTRNFDFQLSDQVVI